MMHTITSRQNEKMKYFCKLSKDKRLREEKGVFVCEGRKLLEEALASGTAILAAVCPETAYQELAPLLSDRDTEIYLVSDELFGKISNVETPQAPFLVCRRPCWGAAPLERGETFVVLDGLQDPGNLGTILRCADAFAISGVLLLEGCADPYSPKTVRSTMGAVFRVPVYRMTEEALFAFCTRRGLPVYGAVLSERSQSIARTDLTRCAVVIGNEGRGVSDRVARQCSGAVMIPMRGQAESLNAAMAATILMWEMAKQREI